MCRCPATTRTRLHYLHRASTRRRVHHAHVHGHQLAGEDEQGAQQVAFAGLRRSLVRIRQSLRSLKPRSTGARAAERKPLLLSGKGDKAS